MQGTGFAAACIISRRTGPVTLLRRDLRREAATAAATTAARLPATSHGRLASASLVFGPSHPPLWPASAAAISGHSRSLRSFSSDTDHPINAKNDKNGFPASSDEGSGHGNFKQQVAASPSLLDLLDEQVEHGGGESEADDGSCNNQNQRAHQSLGISLLDLLDRGSDDDEGGGMGLMGETHNSALSEIEKTAAKLKRKKKRQRKSVRRKKLQAPADATQKLDKLSALPQPKDRKDAELLFAAIAPHLEKRTIMQLKTRLVKFTKDVKKSMQEYENVRDGTNRSGCDDATGTVPVGASPCSTVPALADADTAARSGGEKGGLRILKGRIRKLLGKDMAGEGRKEVLEAIVDDILNLTDTKKGKNANMLYLGDSHRWMKPLLLQYFANSHEEIESTGIEEDIDRSIQLSVPVPENNTRVPFAMAQDVIWTNPKFPPNLNRDKIDRAVEVLMRTREKCLGPQPLFWSKKKARSSARSQARKEAFLMKVAEEKVQDERNEVGGGEEGLNSGDRESNGNASSVGPAHTHEDGSDLKLSKLNLLRRAHADKTFEQLRTEAESTAVLLSDRLPSRSLDKLLDLLEVYAIPESVTNHTVADEASSGLKEMESKPAKKKKRKKWKRFHVLPTFLQHSVKFHMHLVAADLAEFLYVHIPDNIRDQDTAAARRETEGITKKKNKRDSHSLDDRINNAWSEWKKARKDLGTAFMEAQHVYSDLEAFRTMNEERLKDAEDGSELDGGTEDFFAALEREAKRQEKVRKFGTRRKGPKAVFDAFFLNDRFSAEEPIPSLNGKVVPNKDLTIFVDCLPIDASEEEVRELYSRCGPVEDVRLFNHRPDLDPGPPNEATRTKTRKKKRRAGSKINNEMERKRSPVYAMVTFKTIEGCRTASIDQLRIFGMVVRRHPVRTISAHDAITLYLENIPPDLYSIDLEQKLSRALHPDIYVGLDVGQNDCGKPASCEIRFPSFEAAYHAFVELEKIDMGAIGEEASREEIEEAVPCRLHWMKTPEDAVGFWTRQINFDH